MSWSTKREELEKEGDLTAIATTETRISDNIGSPFSINIAYFVLVTAKKYQNIEIHDGRAVV